MTEVRNRVTASEIDSLIQKVDYHVFPNSTVTVCLLSLKNGTKVIGINYGRIIFEEQDWEMGRRESYKDAYNKVWELEGYLVRQGLFENKNKEIDNTLINCEQPGASS